MLVEGSIEPTRCNLIFLKAPLRLTAISSSDLRQTNLRESPEALKLLQQLKKGASLFSSFQ